MRDEVAFPDHGSKVKPELGNEREDKTKERGKREVGKGGRVANTSGKGEETKLAGVGLNAKSGGLEMCEGKQRRIGGNRSKVISRTREGDGAKLVGSARQGNETQELFAKVTETIARQIPKKNSKKYLRSNAIRKRQVESCEGRNVKWGKSKQGVVCREGVDGWKHEANARQKTRVTSKVGESVKKGAWPNDSAGDLDDAHYEYKRKVRKYRSAEGEDVVEAIEVERMIEEWLEAVGVAIRDEVNPTLGIRRGRERRGHDEARNDEETRWEKERTGTRRDEENKDE
ncbi:hypothetical protein EDB89DRAFT_1914722 [Lactarius sanguifluus]|nr:hypothetical protein EDB89DRAFT_1914722 [Lactarius sanguifluus]